jgi:hypothetical protein
MDNVKISSIRKNADLIWSNLCNHRTWNMEELKTTTQLTEPEIYLAIGWLARQGDISFVKIDNKVRIVLAANVFL